MDESKVIELATVKVDLTDFTESQLQEATALAREAGVTLEVYLRRLLHKAMRESK